MNSKLDSPISSISPIFKTLINIRWYFCDLKICAACDNLGS